MDVPSNPAASTKYQGTALVAVFCYLHEVMGIEAA